MTSITNNINQSLSPTSQPLQDAGDTDCQQITYIALDIIAATGLVVGMALLGAEMAVIGFTVVLLSVGIAFVNEVFCGPEETSQTLGPMPINLNQRVIMPDESRIPETPEVRPARQNPLFRTPVQAGNLGVNGNNINMPNPGANLQGTGINPQHFIETLQRQRNVLVAPNNITLEQIKCFFHKINFTDLTAPCCVFSGGVLSERWGDLHASFERYRDAGTIDLNRFIDDLELVILKVERQTDVNTQQFFKWIIYSYMQIEDHLIDPRNADYIPNNDPRIDEHAEAFDQELKTRRDQQIEAVNKRNLGINQLMMGLDGCANRMKMETYEVYRKVLGQNESDLETDIKSRLEDLRFDLLTLLARENSNDSYLPETNRSAQYLLGPTRGITEHLYMENYPNHPDAERIDASGAYIWFNRHYNKEILIDRVKEWMDGVAFLPERGRGISEIEFSRIADWFKDNVPSNYNAALDTTNYQTIGEQYLNERVLVDADADNPDYRIRREAVEHFLKSIGVINDEQVDDHFIQDVPFNFSPSFDY